MNAIDNKLDDLKADIEAAIRRSTSGHLHANIVPFKGRQDERDFEDFIKEYTRVGDSYDWLEAQLLKTLPQVLTGEALAAYDLLQDNEKDTWANVKTNLKNKFVDSESESMARYQLQNRCQKDKESITEFAKVVEQLVKKGYPATNGFTDAQRTSLIVDSFIRGLRKNLKKVMMRKQKPNTLAEAIAQAQKEEMIQTEIDKADESESMKKLICSLENEVRDMKMEIKMEKVKKKEKVNVISNTQNSKQEPNQKYSYRGNKRQNFGRGYKNQNFFQHQQGNPNFMAGPGYARPMYQNSWRPQYQGRGRGKPRGRGRPFYYQYAYPMGPQMWPGQQFMQNYPQYDNNMHQNRQQDTNANFDNTQAGTSNGNPRVYSISKLPFLISLVIFFICFTHIPRIETALMEPPPSSKLFGFGWVSDVEHFVEREIKWVKQEIKKVEEFGKKIEEKVVEVEKSVKNEIVEFGKEIEEKVVEVEKSVKNEIVAIEKTVERKFVEFERGTKQFIDNTLKAVHERITEVENTIARILAIVWFWVKVALIIAASILLIVVFAVGFYYYSKFRFYWTAGRNRNKLKQIECGRASERNTTRELSTTYLDHRVCMMDMGQAHAILPYIHITLNGEIVTSLFDSGASISYCRLSLAQELKLKVQRNNQILCAQAANGSRIEFIGKTSVMVAIGEYLGCVDILVANDTDCPAPLLIGTDIMSRINRNGLPMTIDFANKQIVVGRTQMPLIAHTLNDMRKLPNENWTDLQGKRIKVKAKQNITLKPRTDNIVHCYSNDARSERVYVVEESEFSSQDKLIAVGRTLISPVEGKFFVRILNPTSSNIKIYKNETIAEMEQIDNVGAIQQCDFGSGKTNNVNMLHHPPTFSIGDLIAKLDLEHSILSENGKARLIEIIKQHSEAFGEGGRYKGKIVHRIDLLPGTPPIASRAYRTPIRLKAELEKQIEKLLAQGVIEPSTSAFAAPVVLVPKKDGSTRFAIDYRQLNAATIKSAYHLPLISEILDEVGGKKMFSSFDFSAGFYQIPLHPKHKERTAFSTFLGLFQFVNMPMGLCGAPLTFQRVMHELKKYLSAAFLIYIDDVILASEDEETHLNDIAQFLSVVTKFGMKLKIEKCTFGKKQIKYLGFLVDKEGISIDPKNLQAIEKMPKPKTLKELRSFLGACSYFRKFIKSFAIKWHRYMK